LIFRIGLTVLLKWGDPDVSFLLGDMLAGAIPRIMCEVTLKQVSSWIRRTSTSGTRPWKRDVDTPKTHCSCLLYFEKADDLSAQVFLFRKEIAQVFLFG
jgi:hypothetical protein